MAPVVRTLLQLVVTIGFAASLHAQPTVADLEAQKKKLDAQLEAAKAAEVKKVQVDKDARVELEALDKAISDANTVTPAALSKTLLDELTKVRKAIEDRAAAKKKEIDAGVTAATGASQSVLEFKLPLREGDATVSGRSSAASVMVRVYSGWTSATREIGSSNLQDAIDREEGKNTEEKTISCLTDEARSTAGPVTVTAGAFTAALDNRLNAGDCVVAEDANGKVSARVQGVGLDFGRLRGYFSLGGAVRQSRSNFSQVDTFVGFTADARLAGLVIDKSCKADAGDESRRKALGRTPTATQTSDYRASRKAVTAICEDEDGPLRMRDARMQLNAFTDVRLGFRLAPSSAAASGSAAVATGGAPPQPPFQRPDQLTFGADQSGYFAFALHAPIAVKGMDWISNGNSYSYYIGPIAKVGVESLDAPVIASRLVRIDGAKPETDSTAFSTISEVRHTGALPFWGFGTRMGIYSYDLIGRRLHQRQVGNDPIAYLDFTWGKSKAYRSYSFNKTLVSADDLKAAKTLPPGVAAGDQLIDIKSRELSRMAIEGRIKIPYLPALFGVDINVRNRTSDAVPNEFRFVLAFRVDAQKALARIFPSDALSQ